MRKFSIGFAGTAKNTGKTTTMSTLLNELKKDGGITVGLTGIGYDGESFDNVTGLPKPRIDVFNGMLVAVADRCFKFSRAKVEPLLRTEILTPLGVIVVGRVIKPGKLVLAGPTKKSDLRKAMEYMYNFGAELNIVDGALGRIAPFTETDGLIFSTGAARNNDIEQLAAESACMINLLERPILPEKGVVKRFGSVLSEEGLQAFLQESSGADTMIVEGLFSGQLLAEASKSEKLKGKRLLFSDPLKLLLAGDMKHTYGIMRKMEQTLEIGVQKQISVIAATVNPYYPRYRYEKGDYEAAYVDKELLRNEIERSMRLSCYDVVAQGGEGLFRDVLRFRDTLPDEKEN